jgi:peptidoglycan/LPS O-acetylase OafA/YrhL
MLTSRPYLTTLTPLRGIAALLVVIFHSNLMLMSFIPPFAPHVITAAWLWVDFFFVLSGFIISYVYGDSFRDSLRASSYWKYIRARIARVYPLHLVTLIFCLGCAIIVVQYADGLAPFFADMLSPWSAIPSLLFAQSFGFYISAPLNSPSWSLSTEWWMYMIFPLLVPFFARLKRTGLILTGLAIAGLFVVLMYYLVPLTLPFSDAQPTINTISGVALVRCLAGFVLGMLIFRIYELSLGQTWLSKSAVFVALFAGVLVAMHLWVNDLIIVGFFPLIILAAAYNQSAVKKVLDLAPLQRLGDWSFSIYMVHVPLMFPFWIYQTIENPSKWATFPPESGAPDFTVGLLFCLLLVAATLFLAYLTYTYVEVPARNYINNRFRPAELAPKKVM